MWFRENPGYSQKNGNKFKPYCFIVAYGVDLGAKHYGRERQKEKTLKAQEDKQDDRYGWGEVTAF